MSQNAYGTDTRFGRACDFVWEAEDICGRKLGKFVPVLQVFEGVATAWIPGLLMLIGAW